MSLSSTFNVDPQRKQQLDLLAEAFTILKEQGATGHENRSMHGDIAETRRFIRQWGGDVGDGEFCARSYPNPKAAEVATQQATLDLLQSALITRLARSEEKLVGVMEKVFGGDKKALAAFYAGATPANDYVAQKWTGKAQEVYRQPEGASLPADTAITAIIAKFSGPQAVQSQLAKVNAMIDDGKLFNKVARIAWQMNKRVTSDF